MFHVRQLPMEIPMKNLFRFSRENISSENETQSTLTFRKLPINWRSVVFFPYISIACAIWLQQTSGWLFESMEREDKNYTKCNRCNMRSWQSFDGFCACRSRYIYNQKTPELSERMLFWLSRRFLFRYYKAYWRRSLSTSLITLFRDFFVPIPLLSREFYEKTNKTRLKMWREKVENFTITRVIFHLDTLNTS